MRADTGGMYDDSPARSQMPLAPAEVEQIIASGGKLLKDPRKIVHFAQRVLATMARMKRTTEEMQRDVEAMRIRYEQDSSPIARATKALRNLSAEQRHAVLSQLENERLDALALETSQAEQMQVGARSQANRVRFVLMRLLDEGLPDSAEMQVHELLRFLGSDPAQAARQASQPGQSAQQRPAAQSGAGQQGGVRPTHAAQSYAPAAQPGQGAARPVQAPPVAPAAAPVAPPVQTSARLEEYDLDDLFN